MVRIGKAAPGRRRRRARIPARRVGRGSAGRGPGRIERARRLRAGGGTGCRAGLAGLFLVETAMGIGDPLATRVAAVGGVPRAPAAGPVARSPWPAPSPTEREGEEADEQQEEEREEQEAEWEAPADIDGPAGRADVGRDPGLEAYEAGREGREAEEEEGEQGAHGVVVSDGRARSSRAPGWLT